MFTKRSIRIIAIIAAVVFAAVSVTVLAEAVRSSDELAPTEGLTEGSLIPARNDFRLFVEDYDVEFYKSMSCGDYISYMAAVDGQAAGEFINSLSKMAPRLTSEEEYAKLVEEGVLREPGAAFNLYFYNSDNELVLKLTVCRLSETGEWSNIIETELSGMHKALVIPEENFNGDAIEAVINNAYGGRFDDYLEIKYPYGMNLSEEEISDKLVNGEFGWKLYNAVEDLAMKSEELIPEIDYQTYEDIKDELVNEFPSELPSFLNTNSDAE